MSRTNHLDLKLAILETVRRPGETFSQREIARIAGVSQPTISRAETSAIAKLRARLGNEKIGGRVQIQAASARITARSGLSSLPVLKPGDPLPSEIVWMPAGTHAIAAGTLDGSGYVGTVICDEQAARVVAAQLADRQSKGQRAWLDLNHADGEAAADVRAFSWDPSRGIIAHVEWTPRGERALREKDFSTFSPAFEASRKTGRVEALIEGHALGGLVYAPAFESMPALVSAKFGGKSSEEPEK